MSKRGSKTIPFVGYALTKSEHNYLISLINMTVSTLGAHKRDFKSEAQFWDAIEMVCGFRPKGEEDFRSALFRIKGTVASRPPEWRAVRISKVDRKAFHDFMGIVTHIVVTPEQVQANAKAAKVFSKPFRKPVKAKAQKRVPFDAPTVGIKTEFYASWDWRTLRFEVLKEHGNSCQCCGAGPGMKAADGTPVRICVDHIKPISKFWELRLDRSNLQILCDECNQGKGNWDQTDFRPAPVADEWIIEDAGIDPLLLAQLGGLQ